jgi:hypothetical protein
MIESYVQTSSGCSSLKSVEKGQQLVTSMRVAACSFAVDGDNIYFTGFVKAAMKNKVSYNFKIQLNLYTGMPDQTWCECPAGSGSNATCKHIAAVMLVLSNFSQGQELHVANVCTDKLQSFNKPAKVYNDTPLKSEQLKEEHASKLLFDPRPLEYRNMTGYSDFVRNHLINFVASSQCDISLRYLYPRANIQAAEDDHDYCRLPFLQHWIVRGNTVFAESAKEIEKNTKLQHRSALWHYERRWRITASNFGSVISCTSRRNKAKLCEVLFKSSFAGNKATNHGLKYEKVAIQMLEKHLGMKVTSCGLFINSNYPFLGASPDGLIGADAIVEVKCPFAAREMNIIPGKMFPFLMNNNDGEIVVNPRHKYFAQILGQLAISQRLRCYFVVYTFKQVSVTEVAFDEQVWNISMLPKLQYFYHKHYCPYVASQL